MYVAVSGENLADEVKRVIKTNNASPTSEHSEASAGTIEENSDTQSMEAGPTHSFMHDLGFPTDADRKKLVNLLHRKPEEGSPSQIQTQSNVQVRHVSSARYRSDSSSSGSEPSSPRTSVRTDSVFSESMHSSSMRSSARSSSAVSSDGRITVVTDFDSQSMQESPTQGSRSRPNGPTRDPHTQHNWDSESSTDSEHDTHGERKDKTLNVNSRSRSLSPSRGHHANGKSQPVFL